MMKRFLTAAALFASACLPGAVNAAGPVASYSADPQQSRLELDRKSVV